MQTTDGRRTERWTFSNILASISVCRRFAQIRIFRVKKVAQLAANVRALAAQRNFHSDKHPYLRFPGGIGGGAATVDSNETTCHQIKPRFVFQQSLISPSFQFFPSFLDKKLSILSIFRSRNETATRKKRKRIAPVGRGGKEKKKRKKTKKKERQQRKEGICETTLLSTLRFNIHVA